MAFFIYGVVIEFYNPKNRPHHRAPLRINVKVLSGPKNGTMTAKSAQMLSGVQTMCAENGYALGILLSPCCHLAYIYDDWYWTILFNSALFTLKNRILKGICKIGIGWGAVSWLEFYQLTSKKPVFAFGWSNNYQLTALW